MPIAPNKKAKGIGTKAPMPSSISPMLCTLTKEVVDRQGYLYEIKWDGYRIISYVQKGKVRMDSRSALDYTKKYPPLVTALKQLHRDVVFDGEVVVFNQDGMPDFDALQLYNGHDHPITYCIFDILWLDGYDLMDLTLVERKKILQQVLKGNKTLRFSESYVDGGGLYKLIVEKNGEGIVAKMKDSPYLPGDRSSNWLKTPTRKRQEFVIGGWAESDRARSFRSLLFGAYNEQEQFEWIGRSGGGYKEKEMPAILKQLKALEIKASPFVNTVLDTKGAIMHWVKPELVANFEFATWTKSGRIRKPATFLGFRKDKKAKQVVREVPKVVDKSPKKKGTTLRASAASNWPKVEAQDKENASEFQLDDCSIELFSVERQIWKGVTKADLIQYYHSVAAYILPHIKDRPQSLHVKLNSATAPGVYIKDMEGRQPDCAEIFTDHRRHAVAGKRSVIDYLVCNNEATLLWMINLGCIDVNPWNSRMNTPDEPDYIVIDLDPSEEKLSSKGLTSLQNTAMAAKQYCDQKKLKAFVKTSGKTGIHFLIPCQGFKSTEIRTLGEQICAGIHELVPKDSTITVSKAARGDKVFVDFSQNDYADTISAPYCVRPFHTPLVSTPLDWKEVNFQLDPRDFSMTVMLKRLQNKSDLWDGILDKKHLQRNRKLLRTL